MSDFPEGINAPQGSHPLYGAGLASAVPLVEVMADRIGQLRRALNDLVLEYVDPNGEVHHIANSPWSVAVEKWRRANRLLNDLATPPQADAKAKP